MPLTSGDSDSDFFPFKFWNTYINFGIYKLYIPNMMLNRAFWISDFQTSDAQPVVKMKTIL